MRINWANLSPSTYEDMVAVLLNSLRPATQHIDGAGGDEGRDLQFEDDEGLHVFELKSFSGRMNSSRRRQVQRSLDRAAALKPVTWTLVVPINPNPAELQWFEKLQEKHSFHLEWLGRTWLEGQFAVHQRISRYFLEGGEAEAIRLLKELREEEAALAGGLPQALERASRLAAQLNELDPYYRFRISMSEDVQTVQVMPRFAGAESERPITFNLVTAFPDSPEGQAAADAFKDFIEFGIPVDLPGEYIKSFEVRGLPGATEFPMPELLRFGPAAHDMNLPVDADLVAIGPEGFPLAQVPLTFTHRTVGRRGAIVHGEDRAGALRVSMTLRIDDNRVNINFQFETPRNALPSDILPALRLVSHLHRPNLFNIRMLGHWFNQDAVPVDNAVFTDTDYVRLMEDLATIQNHGQVYFPIPERFSREDQVLMRDVVELLKGEPIEFNWNDASMVMSRPGVMEVHKLAQESDDMPLYMDSHVVLTIFDKDIPIGRVATKMFAARLADPDEVEAFLSAPGNEDDELRVRLVAGSTTRAEKQLIRPTDT